MYISLFNMLDTYVNINKCIYYLLLFAKLDRLNFLQSKLNIDLYLVPEIISF